MRLVDHDDAEACDFTAEQPVDKNSVSDEEKFVVPVMPGGLPAEEHADLPSRSDRFAINAQEFSRDEPWRRGIRIVLGNSQSDGPRLGHANGSALGNLVTADHAVGNPGRLPRTGRTDEYGHLRSLRI